MSIWLLVLYAVAMAMLTLDGTVPAALCHSVAAVSLLAFTAAVAKFGIRKPVV